MLFGLFGVFGLLRGIIRVTRARNHSIVIRVIGTGILIDMI